MTACIIGWAHTPFGKHSDETVESLVTRVAREAVEHAGLEASDIDEIYLGHFNAGFSAQDFTASLVLQADDDFRFKPATRVENACATGSAAVHQGIKAIRAGAAKRVLVVGVEQMTTTPGPQVGANLLRASYLPEDGDTPAGFAGVFGKIADGYFQKYGDQSDGLAAIAAKNHKNGVDNPWAQMRKDLGYEFCRAESDKNPYVAGPLKRTDCSLVSDGAAAIVLADVTTAMQAPRAVLFRAAEHVQDSCRCPSATFSPSRAARSAGSAPSPIRRPRSTISPSSRPTTASPSPNSSSMKPWGSPSRGRRRRGHER
jgi:acetyl-CoA C-acetyltransferase